jgi:prophage antirepressor-like protein
MDIIKAFILDNSNYNVHILLEDSKPLFRASDIATVMGIKNIHTSLVNINSDYKVLRQTETLGGSQETIFLKEQAVYRLVMRSNKPIAQPFQDWLCEVIASIRETGKYELQQEMKNIKETKEKTDQEILELKNQFITTQQKYETDLLLNAHNSLIDSFDNKNVVYFGLIKKMDNDQKLIKIGSTQDIRKRGMALNIDFGNMIFFTVLACAEHKNFERFLHGHTDIKRYLYTQPINGMKISTEIFLMNDEEIKKTINIANRNISQFSNLENSYKSIKNTISELKNDVQTDINNLKSDVQDILYFIQNQEQDKNVSFNEGTKNDTEESNNEAVEYPSKRGICTINGSKVQRYDTTGKVLIHTYNSVMDALRDSTIKKPSRNGILDAIDRNTIYNEFRWLLLDRALPNDTVQILEETVEIGVIRKGYVCELNEDKTVIINVFSNQKRLNESKGFKSSGYTSILIKTQKMWNNSYFMCWCDCSDELQQNYLENNELPEEDNAKPHQIKILKLDPETREVIHRYNSITEVTIKYKITARTLKSAINGDLVKRNYRWMYHSP